MHDQEGDTEPAHHARRPMNAFLIFCKRHRSVVRDKYPNLENRSITKILGEWWANLDKEEKACYTGLAKQYKDAFFSANPDFKWYKLPAPPLRTLSSRPRDATDKPADSPHVEPPDIEAEKTNNNSTRIDFNKRIKEVGFEDEPKLSMFTPGKLADEAQMGGLSSLLATKTETQTPNPYYSPPSFKFNAISTPNDIRSLNLLDPRFRGLKREDNIRELQNALSETTRVFEEDFDVDKHRVYAHTPQNEFTNQDVINQIVDKRYSGEDYGYPRSGSDDERMRTGRSCKGKRYQEFMAVGGLIVNKRQKREYNDRGFEDYNATCSWEASNSRNDSSLADANKISSHTDISADTDQAEHGDAHEPDNSANKTFKAADFDLDAKIRALPSLSLEKFQQKKRENKRKKKQFCLRPKLMDGPGIVNSVPRPHAEEVRYTAIGSQKRKPRKVSITRLELGTMEGLEPQPQHVDLLALATLAEVAANTCKLDDSAVRHAYEPIQGPTSTV